MKVRAGEFVQALPIYDFTLYLLNDSAESAMTCVKLSYTSSCPFYQIPVGVPLVGSIEIKTQTSSVQKAVGNVLLHIAVDKKMDPWSVRLVMQKQIITYY